MKPLYKNSLSAVVLILSLSGCSSLFGVNSARSTPNEASELALGTEAGRSHLSAGQNALAIESFRRALASGEPIAPAVNGLGVAYVRLGRFDLAKRYFQQALAIDPDNPRYSDNLARVMLAMNQEIYAVESRKEIASEIAKPPITQIAEATPADTHMKRLASGEIKIVTAGQSPGRTVAKSSPSDDPAPRGQMVRVSRGEVQIMTARPAPAPANLANSQLDRSFKPLARISFAEVNEAK